MQNKKQKPLTIKKTLFVFFTILLSLFILELALRLNGYLHLRFTYPSKAIQKKSGEFNVLCLGDSFTQGFGALAGYSYPEQLAQLLNEHPGYKNRFNVYKEFRINSSSILKYLNRDIEKYKPVFIIIMTGCNDKWSLENCTYFDLENSNFLTKINIWLGSSNVYKLIKISLLNAKGLLSKSVPWFKQSSVPYTEVIYGGQIFKNSAAKEHFELGELSLITNNIDLALREYKIVEQLEPEHTWVNFRLAYIYFQVFKDKELGIKYALRSLAHGDSSIVDHIFMLMYDNIADELEMDTVIADLEKVIRTYYYDKQRTKALKNLKLLFSFYKNDKKVARIIGYNLDEIMKIIRPYRINVVLMQLPVFTPWARETIEKKAYLFRVPLIDNFEIIEKRLKDTKIKREDLFAKDGHCNAKGYSIVAENVYDSLLKNRIIDDVISK